MKIIATIVVATRPIITGTKFLTASSCGDTRQIAATGTTPEAGQPAPEREGERERPVDVDAEPARHALIVDGRPHLRAEARVFESADEHEGDGERHAD